MDPSWIPGEPALSMPGGSGIWGDAAWQVGVGSGGMVATPDLPLLLAAVA